MDVAHLLRSLEQTPTALTALLAGLSDEDAAWRPAPRPVDTPGRSPWSIDQVVWHMLDEERHDFRPRLRSTLDDPQAVWAPIDPEAAVHAQDPGSRPLSGLCAEFEAERRASLAWLRQLERPDWTRTYAHEQVGSITAGDLLTSWAAHDLLHLRQVAARIFRRIEAAGAPHTPRYAGPLT